MLLIPKPCIESYILCYIVVTLNIGRTLTGQFELNDGQLLRSLVALGIVFNLQVFPMPHHDDSIDGIC